MVKYFKAVLQNLFSEVFQVCTRDTASAFGKNLNRATTFLNTSFWKFMRLKNNCSSFAVIKNNAEFRQFASARLAGRRTEALEFYLLDKGGDVKRICTFTDGDPESVVVRPEEVVKLISVYRPHGVYMAHNHVDCPCSPSAADDDMTKKVQMICSLNNVRFYDHCIFAPDGYYSYFMTNRLDEIAREFSVSNLFKNDL